MLAHPSVPLRREAFHELHSRGEKKGWKAMGWLTLDPVLKGLFVSLKNPFTSVGVAVGEETFGRVQQAWERPEEKDAEGRRLTLGFRHWRLEVLSPAAKGSPLDLHVAATGEGVRRVGFGVLTLDALGERMMSLGTREWAPSPDQRGETRFFFVPLAGAAAGETVLSAFTPLTPSR
jgi:hypothetical protein